MKHRVLALVTLTGALVPVWAGEVFTHDTRINRMRITTVLDKPNDKPALPKTKTLRQNRMRLTTILDAPPAATTPKR